MERAAPLSTRAAYRGRGLLTRSQDRFVFSVFFSSKTISRSSNPPADATAYACACSRQRHPQSDRPEEAHDRWVLRWERKWGRISERRHLGPLGAMDQAMKQALTRRRAYFGGRGVLEMHRNLTTVRCRHCERRTEALYKEDENGMQNVDRNIRLRMIASTMAASSEIQT